MLSGEPQAVHRVGSTVGPLSELLRSLGERHVWTDGAVDYRLRDTHTVHLAHNKHLHNKKYVGQVIKRSLKGSCDEIHKRR